MVSGNGHAGEECGQDDAKYSNSVIGANRRAIWWGMKGHKTLEAWKSAHAVVAAVFEPEFRASHPAHYPIYDQLRRAALSVQLNIAEGYGLRSAPAFRRHLVIAFGSSVEAGDLLELLLEKNLGPASVVRNLLATTHRTQQLVLGLIHRYTKPTP